ncbi:MAG: hypothetical protein ABIH23_14465 [bacterium]
MIKTDPQPADWKDFKVRDIIRFTSGKLARVTEVEKTDEGNIVSISWRILYDHGRPFEPGLQVTVKDDDTVEIRRVSDGNGH